MTRAEALNVAWHVRVNGLRGVSQPTLIDAFAALEQQLELHAELSECRAQLQVFRDANEAAELRIAELRRDLGWQVACCKALQVSQEQLAIEAKNLRATIARVEALGSGPGFRVGDDALVKLGDVRAALRGKPCPS